MAFHNRLARLISLLGSRKSRIIAALLDGSSKARRRARLRSALEAIENRLNGALSQRKPKLRRRAFVLAGMEGLEDRCLLTTGFMLQGAQGSYVLRVQSPFTTTAVSLTQGTLPSGVSLSQVYDTQYGINTWGITGTPAAGTEGSYNLSLHVSDYNVDGGSYDTQMTLAVLANKFADPNPAPAGDGFGSKVVTLTNGNVVITAPTTTINGMYDVGAVYLYNGWTGALISTLQGSNTGDYLGQASPGITALPSGNFLVSSPLWSSGTGAVTWVNGNTGLNGVVSSANSLVGSSAVDGVGNVITVLANGNYVVNDSNWASGAGAVTWGSGTAGISGVISSVNSLVGSAANDQVGNVTTLPDGNYVVTSPNWSSNKGAATWASGTAGVKGVISSTNSLIGSTANDYVGSDGVTVLTNGNYLVKSGGWSSGKGAITWASASVAPTGVVTSANSLVGSTAGDFNSSQIVTLPSGNYLVAVQSWSNYTGALTWGSGTAGVSGVISSANSLVGSAASDRIGYSVQVLPSGNYVATSWFWSSYKGELTWGSGTAGVKGVVSSANSLVGSSANEYFGQASITVLPSGNYLAPDPAWSSYKGALTWGSGTAALTGVVSSANSLVGSSANDSIGSNGITLLSNGNYLVSSPSWSSSRGALTWGSGTAGITGVVSSINSLVGSSSGDSVGSGGISLLTNGNYVVVSPGWSSGKGAVTWENASTGLTGIISSANSLVGSTANNASGTGGDSVGSGGITLLPSGNYVVKSPYWSNGSATCAGAVTWGSGTAGVSGVLSSVNSLVGTTPYDLVGGYGNFVSSSTVISVLANGNYVINSPNWSSATGAVTWGSGTSGIRGVISSTNSLIGSATGEYLGFGGVSVLSGGNYVVCSPQALSGKGAVTWGNGTTGVTGVVSSSNSLVGATADYWRLGDRIGDGGVTVLPNGNYVVIGKNYSVRDDNGYLLYQGAVTWGSGATGVRGVVSVTNSLVGTDSTISITLLTNGNYLVVAPEWSGSQDQSIYAGAVAWASGTTAVTGIVSSANSLVGSTYRTMSGWFGEHVGSGGITLLPNGNYLVLSPNWKIATPSFQPGWFDLVDAGAVTWGNGVSGTRGVVTSANSLVGSTGNDAIGSGGITVLSSGNYLVNSPGYQNFITLNGSTPTVVGALTWGSGTAGVKGVISPANSLIGPFASSTPVTNAVTSSQYYAITSPVPIYLPITNSAPASIAVAASAGTITYSTPVTFTATVTRKATGSVIFYDGLVPLATVALTGNTATYTSTVLSGGSHSISAVYKGDNNYGPNGSSAVTVTVNKAGSSTALASSALTSTYGTGVTFTATLPSDATGTVTYFDGNTPIGTSTVSKGTATISTQTLNAGSHGITAVYSGDSNYQGSTSSAQNLTVNQAATTTCLLSSISPAPSGTSVTFTAAVSNGATGTVTFYDGNTQLGTATLSNGIATYSISSLTTGSHSITATYAGNSNYLGSTSGTLSQTILKSLVISSSTNWSAITGGSGTGGQPNASDAITVNSGVTLTVNVANAVVGVLNIVGTLAVSNTYSLTVGALAAAGSVTLGGSSASISVGANDATSTYGGVISGSGSLVKIGTGTVTLSGANTYTGTTTINAGTLTASGGSAIPDASAVILANAAGATLNLAKNETIGSLTGGGSTGGAVTLGSNTLTVGSDNTSPAAFAGVIGGTGNLVKSGTGTLTLSGANIYTGTTSINAGTLTASGGSALPDASAVILANAAGATLNLANNETIGSLTGGGASGGNVTLNANTLTVGSDNTSPAAFAGVISGTGNLAKTGTGTLTLSGANTYTGITTISGGTLSVTSIVVSSGSSNLGNATSGIVLDGGTLAYTGAAVTFTRGFTVTANGGSFTNTTANLVSVSGSITATGILGLNAGGSGGIMVSGVISGAGGVRVYSGGSGLVGLSGANTFTGATTITAGTLSVATVVVSGGASNIGNATSPVILDGGTLSYAGTGESFARGFTVTANGGTLINNTANTLTISGGLTTSGTLALNAGGAGMITISGSISGSGGLAVNSGGSGVVTLSGSNTYTGATTINAGLLTAAGGVAIPDASAVSLAKNSTAGLTLTSNETIGSLTGGGGTGGNVTLGTNTLTVGADNSSPAAYAGVISGSGNLVKTGTGTLMLSGANTYSGTTTIRGGSLSVGNFVVTGGASNLGNAGSAITLDGGTLVYSGAAASLTRGLTVTNNGGTLVNTTTNPIAVKSDIATAGVFTVSSTGQGDISLNGAISGSGGVTVNSTGTGVVNLVGANTYTGLTTISSGTLNAASVSVTGGASHLGNTASDLILDGGTFNYVGAGETFTRGLTVTANGGMLNSTTSNLLTVTGGIASAGSFSLNATSSGGIAINGVISGSGGVTVNSTGTGTVSLSGSNTYTGTTTISAGILSANNLMVSGGASSLGNANSPVILDGGTLAYAGSAASYNRGLSVTSNGGALSNTTANLLTVTGPIATVGTLSLNAASTGSIALSGVISGAGGVTVNNTGSGTVNLSGSNTYTGSTTINSGTLTASGGSAIPDTSSVVLANTAGAVLNLANSETIGSLTGGGSTGGNVTLGANTLSVGADNTSPAAYLGAISGSGNLVKTGTGTLTLSGASTFTGSTTISGGVMSVSNIAITGGASSLGNSSNPVVIDGGTLSYIGSGETSPRGVSVTANGGTLLNTTANAVTFSGAGSLAGTLTLNASSTGNLGLSGVISGAGGLIINNSGTGSAILAGTNTYRGPTNINKGSLTASGGSASSAMILANTIGVSLILAGNEAIGSLSGSGNGVNLSYYTLTVGNDNTSTTYTSPITGSGSLVKAGTGTLTLSANNTYTGTTTVSGGTLSVGTIVVSGGSSNIGNSSTAVVLGGGNLRYTGNAATFTRGLKAANSGGTFINTTANLVTISGTITTGTINAGAQIGLNANSTGGISVTGAISGTTGLSVGSTGTGVVTVSNTNTFTGPTTVTSGELDLNSQYGNGIGGALSIGSSTTTALVKLLRVNQLPDTSTVTLNTGSTLNLGAYSDTIGTIKGTGTVSATTGTLTANAGVNPGGSSSGILNTPNLVVGSNATFTVNLNSITVGSGYSQANVTGTVDLGVSTLVMNLGAASAIGSKYTIVNNDGTDTVTNTFASLAEGSTITDPTSGQTFTISYKGGTGNDVVITTLTGAASKTTVSLPASSMYGQPAALTATVSPSSAIMTGTPTGTVQFQVDGTNVGGLVTLVAGTATLPYSLMHAGTHTVTAVYSGDSFFTNSTSTGQSMAITKAHLTVTADAATKTYDGQIFTDFTATISGLLNGDAVGGIGLNGGPTYDGAALTATNAGTYTITPGAGNLTANDYDFTTFVSGNLTIAKAGLTVTADDQTKSYDGQIFTGFTAVLSGFIEGDTLESSGVTGVPGFTGAATTAVAMGNYTITPTAGTLSSPNYDFSSFASGNLHIGMATLTITANSLSKTYGSAITLDGGTQFSTSGLISGDTVGSVTLTSLGTGVTAFAGSYAITPSAVTGGTFNPSNYNIVYKTGTLTVTPAPLTITANDQSKTYGQTVFFGNGGTQFNISAGSLKNGDTIGSVTLSVNNNGGNPTAPVSGSPYTITPSAAAGGTFDSGNYAITYAPGKLTVSPAHLTVTADNQTKVYDGSTAGSFASKLSGFVNGENLLTSGVAGSASYSGPAVSAVDWGTYNITPTKGTLAATNYDFTTFKSGTLTIVANTGGGGALDSRTVNAGGLYFRATGSFNSGGSIYSTSGLVQVGFAPAAGQSFVPLIELSGSVTINTSSLTFSSTGPLYDALTGGELPLVAAISNASITDLIGPGLLVDQGNSVSVEGVKFQVSSIAIHSGASPELWLQGNVDLGVVKLAVDGQNHVAISQTGLSLTGVDASLPDASFSLGSVTFDTAGLMVAYTSGTNKFVITGTATANIDGLGTVSAKLGGGTTKGLVFTAGAFTSFDALVSIDATLAGGKFSAQENTLSYSSVTGKYSDYGPATFTFGTDQKVINLALGDASSPGVVVTNGSLSSLNATATITNWAIAGGVFSATAKLVYTAASGAAPELFTITGSATEVFGTGTSAKTLGITLGGNGSPGLVISNGKVTSLMGGATASNWSIAGGTFSASATVNYLPASGDTPETLAITGSATETFGSNTLTLSLGSQAVAATANSPAIPATIGILLRNNQIASLNAKGTITNWSVGGATINASALVTYRPAQTSPSSPEILTVTGAASVITPGIGTIQVLLGSDPTKTSPATTGLILRNGVVDYADMSINSNITAGGLTFTTTGLRMVYDRVPATYTLTGASSFTYGSNTIGVVLGGTNTFNGVNTTTAGLVLTNGALTSIDMTVKSAITVGSLTFNADNLRFTQSTVSGKPVFTMSGASSFTATGLGKVNVLFGSPASGSNVATKGLVLTNGSLTSLDMAIDSNITVSKVNLSTKGLRFGYVPASGLFTLGGNATATVGGMGTFNVQFGFGGSAGLVVQAGALVNMDMTITSHVSLGAVDFDLTGIRLQYTRATNLYSMGGNASVAVGGIQGLAVQFGHGNDPGVVLANGNLMVLDATINAPFTVGSVTFTAKDLEFKYVNTSQALNPTTGTCFGTYDASKYQFSMFGTGSVTATGMSPVSVTFGHGTTPGLTLANGKLESLTLTVNASFGVSSVSFTAKDLEFAYQNLSQLPTGVTYGGTGAYSGTYDTTKPYDSTKYQFSMGGTAIVSVQGMDPISVTFGHTKAGVRTPGLTLVNGNLENLDVTVSATFKVGSVAFGAKDLEFAYQNLSQLSTGKLYAGTGAYTETYDTSKTYDSSKYQFSMGGTGYVSLGGMEQFGVTYGHNGSDGGSSPGIFIHNGNLESLDLTINGEFKLGGVVLGARDLEFCYQNLSQISAGTPYQGVGIYSGAIDTSKTYDGSNYRFSMIGDSYVSVRGMSRLAVTFGNNGNGAITSCLTITNGNIQSLNLKVNAEFTVASVIFAAQNLMFTYQNLSQLTPGAPYSGIGIYTGTYDGTKSYDPSNYEFSMAGTASVNIHGSSQINVTLGHTSDGVTTPGLVINNGNLESLDLTVNASFRVGGVVFAAQDLEFTYQNLSQLTTGVPYEGTGIYTERYDNTKPYSILNYQFSMSGTAKASVAGIDMLNVTLGHNSDGVRTPGLVINNGNLESLDLTVNASFIVSKVIFVAQDIEFSYQNLSQLTTGKPYQGTGIYTDAYDTSKPYNINNYQFMMSGTASVYIIGLDQEQLSVSLGHNSDGVITPGIVINNGNLESLDFTVNADFGVGKVSFSAEDLEFTYQNLSQLSDGKPYKGTGIYTDAYDTSKPYNVSNYQFMLSGTASMSFGGLDLKVTSIGDNSIAVTFGHNNNGIVTPGLTINNGNLESLDVTVNADFRVGYVLFGVQDLEFTYQNLSQLTTGKPYKGSGVYTDGYDTSRPYNVNNYQFNMSGSAYVSIAGISKFSVTFGHTENGVTTPGMTIVNGNLESIAVTLNGTFYVGAIGFGAKNLEFIYQNTSNLASPYSGTGVYVGAYTGNYDASKYQFLISGTANLYVAGLNALNVSFGHGSTPGLVIVNGKLKSLDLTVNSNINLGVVTFQVKDLEFTYYNSTADSGVYDSSRYVFTMSGSASINTLYGVSSLSVTFGTRSAPGLVIANGWLYQINVTVNSRFNLGFATFNVQDVSLNYTNTSLVHTGSDPSSGYSLAPGYNAYNSGKYHLTLTGSASVNFLGIVQASVSLGSTDSKGIVTSYGLVIDDGKLTALDMQINASIGINGVNLTNANLHLNYVSSTDTFTFYGGAHVNFWILNVDCTMGDAANPGLVISRGSLQKLNFSLTTRFGPPLIYVEGRVTASYDAKTGTLDFTGHVGVGLTDSAPEWARKFLGAVLPSVDVRVHFVNGNNSQSYVAFSTHIAGSDIGLKVSFDGDVKIIVGGVLGDIVRAFQEFAHDVELAWQKTAETFSEAYKKAAAGLAYGAQVTWDAIKTAGRAIEDGFKKIGDAIVSGFNTVRSWFNFPIANGVIYFDPGFFGVYVDGRPIAYTDAAGMATLTIPVGAPRGQLVGYGGIITATGMMNPATLTAPSDSEVVSTLSTLINNLMKADPTLSESDAIVKIDRALGLSETYNLLQRGTITNALQGDATSGLAYAAEVKAYVFAHEAAALLTGVTDTRSYGNLMTDAFNAMANWVAANPGQPLDLSNQSVLSSLIQDIVDTDHLTISSQAVSDGATLIGRVEGQIDAEASNAANGLSYLQQIAMLQTLADGQLAMDLANAKGDPTTLDNLVATDTTEAIAAAAGNVTIGNVIAPVLSVNSVEGAVGAGQQSSFTFTVSVAGPSSTLFPISVNYSTADLTATVADGDYTPTSGTLTWAPGDTSPKTITVPVAPGATPGIMKSFKLNLAEPTNAVNQYATGVGTIDYAQVATETVLQSNQTSAPVGTAVTYTATVNRLDTTNSAAQGTIAFYEGSTLLDVETLDSNGMASFTTTDLALGSHAIMAQYIGQAVFGLGYQPSSSSELDTQITATGQTITFPGFANVTYGSDPIPLAAASDQGLTVSYAVLSGPAYVADSMLYITGAGHVVVEATQDGTETIAQAVPVDQAFDVAKATLTVTTGHASSVYGDAIPQADYSIQGFVNGDSTSNLATLPTAGTVAVGSPVGTYSVTASGGTDSNYDLVYLTGTLTITPATLTFSIDNQTMTYGGTVPSLTYTISGFVNGDSASRLTSLPVLSSALATANAGSYTISGSGAANPNYNLQYIPGTLTIAPATLTITAVNQSMLYGDPVIPTCSYSGFVNGDTADSLTLAPTLTGVSSTPNVGTYTVTPINAIDTNYVISYTPGTLTVTPAPLTVTVSGVSRVYGQNDPTLTVTYTGLVHGDTASVLGGSLTLANSQGISANAGTYTGALTASGLSSSNYSIQYVAGTLAVAPAPLTISIIGTPTKVYDGTTAATLTSGNFRVLGLIEGDSLIVTQTTGTYDSKNVFNAGTVSAALDGTTVQTGTGTLLSNYALPATVTGLGGITARTLNVTAQGNDKAYDGTTTATVTLTDDRVTGDSFVDSYISARFADPGIDTNKQITVTGISISGLDDGNYVLASTSASTTASLLTLSSTHVSLASTANSSVYGQTGTLTASVTALMLGAGTPVGTVQFQVDGANLGSPVALVNGVATLNLPTNLTVGSHKLLAIFSGGSDSGTSYMAARSITGLQQITPAPLTITANDVSRVYGAADPALGVTYSGLVNGETSSVLKGTLKKVDARSATNTGVGTYAGAITASGLTSTNYTITYVPGNLTVTRAHLSVTTAAKSKSYDGTVFTGFSVTVTGFVNGENATTSGLAGTAAFDGAATTAVNAGSYAITPTQGTLSAANYDFTKFTGGTLTISRKALTATIVGTPTKVYDGTTTVTLTPVNFSMSGLASGESFAVTKTTGAYGSKAVLDAANVTTSLAASNFTAATGTLASNYILPTTAGGAGVITARALTITFTAANKVYDGLTSVTPLTITDNRVVGDKLTIGYGAATFTDKNAGYRAINVTGVTVTSDDCVNYTFSTTASTGATITPLALTATPTIAGKTYDGTTAATVNSYSLPGAISGDTVNATGGIAVFTSKAAGTGVVAKVSGITLTGADSANYTVNSIASVTATIVKRPLTVTATGIDRVQNGSTTASVLLSDDRLVGDVLTDTYTSATFPSSTPGTYTVTVTGIAISGADAGNYICNTTATTTATITATATTPTMITQPVSQTVTPGTSVSFSAAASGSPTVQWQSSTNGGSTWTNITGATNTTYTVTPTLVTNGTLYRAVFRNAAGSVTSATATLSVVQAQVISVAVQWGSQTASLTDASAAAGRTIKRLLPAGRTNSIPWLNINTIKVTLDRPVASLTAANIALTSAVAGTSYNVTSVTGSGTSWTITFKNNNTNAATAANGIIVADRVNVSLSNSQSPISTYTRELNVLPGDVLDAGVVSLASLSAIRNYYTLGTLPSFALAFLDINGDGKVDASDYTAASSFLGKKLV